MDSDGDRPRRKPGPKSFTQRAQRPRRIGLHKRKQWRINQMKSKHTMRRYRYGYNLIFGLPTSSDYVRKLKHLPAPGSCDLKNQHGGAMPALPGELQLSGKQGATILEKCAETDGVTWDQLRAVSACLSYLHSLVTGDDGTNWEDVSQIWESLDPQRYKANKLATRLPTHIPSVAALKRAFLRDWVPGCEMSFADWLSGYLSGWSWGIFGCRPNIDIGSLKQSSQTTISHPQSWACTEFEGGRNKLHGQKRGGRPWAQYYICLCPGGVHKQLPAEFGKCLDKAGNPTEPIHFPTYCPLNVLALKDQLTRGPLRIFAKWTGGSREFGQRNHGSIPDLANRWFAAQGAQEDNTPYSSNAGRRSCARWLQETHTPYHEGFEVHGDLYDVWINYQPNCQKSNFARRTQSRDPHVATAALRRFAYLLGRGPRARVRNLDLSTKLMLGFLESNGQALLAQQIVEQHRQQSSSQDDDMKIDT